MFKELFNIKLLLKAGSAVFFIYWFLVIIFIALS